MFIPIQDRRPDLAPMNKMKKELVIVRFDCSSGPQSENKEKKKTSIYLDLVRQLKKCETWKCSS